MKKVKTLLLTIALIISVPCTAVLAQDFVSIVAGKSVTREFYVHGPIGNNNIPGYYFVVSVIGTNDLAEDMTITVKAKPERDFRSRMIYSLAGAGFSPVEGVAPVFSVGAVPGPDLSTTVSINSDFGIYFLGVTIDAIIGDVETRVPFSITFSVSKPASPEEG